MLTNIATNALSNQDLTHDITEEDYLQEYIPEAEAEEPADYNYYTATATDQHNNIYVTHNPSTSAVLTKFDANSNLIYTVDVSKQLNEISLINKIITDNQDNVYLIGSRISITDIEPAIYKYSPDGKLLWRRFKQHRDMRVPTYSKYKDHQNQFEIASIYNNIIYVAAFLSPRDLGDSERIYIAAYSNQGKLLTSTVSGITLDRHEIGYLATMSNDLQGNVYISGSIEDINPPSEKAFICKLSSKLKPLQMETYHEADMTAYVASVITPAPIVACDIKEVITNLPLHAHIFSLTSDLKDETILYSRQHSSIKALCVKNGRIVFITRNDRDQLTTLVSIPMANPTNQSTIEKSLIGINGYMLEASSLSVSEDGSIVIAGCVLDETECTNIAEDANKPILLKYSSNLELQWTR